ncbi:MerR family transcriptional regulator [Parafilimonas sp.]|uniref:MerR family transcriptional regulator n=1 Tax=Parafilimonas sp. TaxID=1969739 RepID=UPI0039E34CE7
MQQLDLFNNNNDKIAVIRPKRQPQKKAVEANAPAEEQAEEKPAATKIVKVPIPAQAEQCKEDTGLTGKAKSVQLIKPLSRKAEQPSKRGRKSLKEINLDVALLDIPADEVLFQKQYYSISEVAQWFNMKPSLLRFWENEFDILKPRKNKKGDRLFRPEDVKNLRLIYYLLRQQKYSVEGARQYLKDNQKKAAMQVQLVESLTKFRSFLLELRANLGA